MPSLADRRDEPRATPLQTAVLELASLLADVRELDERRQAAFASIAQRAIVQSLGGAMVVDEAEDILRLAA
jgi:hypothetical protein